MIINDDGHKIEIKGKRIIIDGLFWGKFIRGCIGCYEKHKVGYSGRSYSVDGWEMSDVVNKIKEILTNE